MTPQETVNPGTVIEDVLEDVDFDFSAFDADEDLPVKASMQDRQAFEKPKDCLIKFLTSTKLDEHYTFTYAGTKEEAKKYTHNMRVELSRLRDKIRKMGKQNIHFKFVVVSVFSFQHEETGYSKTRITIMRTVKKQPVENLPTSVIDALEQKEQTK